MQQRRVVHCDDDEVAYFMRSLSELLPGLGFDTGQIVYSYSGIRPLPNTEGVAPGLISRDHSAPLMPADANRPFPLMSLVGGKWTTFRAFAAQIADNVLAHLGQTRRIATDALPIGGGHDMPCTPDTRAAWVADLAGQTGATPARVEELLDRYGTTADAIARHEGNKPVLLEGAETFSEAEIDWIVRNERVVHLEDILLRRTPLAITGQLARANCLRICEIAANAAGWSDAEATLELERVQVTLKARHGVFLWPKDEIELKVARKTDGE